MRTWFGLNADGCLCSIESHYGGWPAEADFNNPGSHLSLPSLVAARQAIGVVSFYMHNCACGPERGSCDCHNGVVQNHFVDGGALKIRPATSVMINGFAYATRAQAVVGASFTVKVTGDVPDGAEVEITFALPSAAKTTTKLVFAAGTTPEHTINMPTPSIGLVGVIGRLVRPVGIYVQRPAP